MHLLYEPFVRALEAGDREECVLLVMNALSSGNLDMMTLYMEILEPSLNRMVCVKSDHRDCIWHEHMCSAIVRTVMECTYPFLVQERNQRVGKLQLGKVMVVCPAEELHEIGARMAADFYTLFGYQALFVGANTPSEDIAQGVRIEKPRYVAVSVTNSYNLVTARRMIEKIRNTAEAGFMVLAGGRAFISNPQGWLDIGADRLVHTFLDIEKLSKEDQSYETSI